MFGRFKFSTQLFAAFLLIATLPLLVAYFAYSKASGDSMSELYSKNTYEILRENNAYFDRKLTDILDRAIKLTYDRDIFNVYNEVSGKTRYRVAHYDSMVNAVLVKYFNVRDNDIFSINLTTSYYSFGTRYLPAQIFMSSDEYERALKSGGNPVWETEFLASESAYENLFSCNILLDLFYYTDGASGIKYVLSKNKERPVLTVNLKDSIFSDIFNQQYANPWKPVLCDWPQSPNRNNK